MITKKIKQYIIRQDRTGCTYLFDMIDENDLAILSIAIKGIKIEDVQYDGSHCEFNRHRWNHRTTIFKDGKQLCRVGPVSGYGQCEVKYSEETILLKYNGNFNNITIYEDSEELGKVSRKITGSKKHFRIGTKRKARPSYHRLCFVI